MPSVTFELPDDVFTALKGDAQETSHMLCLAAAFSLCRQGKLSTSQAARMAGLSYSEFLDAAGRSKLDIYPVHIEELAEEVGRGFTLGRQRLADHSSS